MKAFILLVTVFAAQSLWAQRIEVGDDISRIETSSPDGLSLRATNRIGVGLAFLGPTGTAGVNMEVNFHPRWGMLAGIGTNEDFQSFYLEYKRTLAGESFVPYGVLGLARWQGNQGAPITSTDPSFLYEDFMSPSERQEGKISETLIYPGIGIQYLQLSGEWRGFSVFAQLSLFMDVMDLEIGPEVGFGSTWYF